MGHKYNNTDNLCPYDKTLLFGHYPVAHTMGSSGRAVAIKLNMSSNNEGLHILSVTKEDEKFMREAIRMADESVEKGGGPFGAAIVKDGGIVALASNSVTLDNDPTAHAEVNCIRKACAALGTFDLEGCVIYTSCEPCPMCLGAIYWAHLDRIYYANDRKDAAAIGFDDDFIYRELDKSMGERSVPIIPMIRDEALHTFKAWAAKTDKTEY